MTGSSEKQGKPNRGESAKKQKAESRKLKAENRKQKSKDGIQAMKLKRQDNMEWTRRMNTICHDAEEMILTEMIYTKG